MTSNPPAAARGESPLTSLAINIAAPALILYKLSSPERLGPIYALLLALSLPAGSFLFGLVKTRKTSFIAALGFVSTLLSGSFGLMKLDGIWFAVKEAAIPLLLGVAVVASMYTRRPLVKAILYNDNVIDVARVDKELNERGNVADFQRLLALTTWLLAASFLLSAILNFSLAAFLLKSPTGSEAFNKELGKMTALSYPVIVLPCMAVTGFALWRLLAGIKKLTGLDLEAIFKGATPPPKKTGA